jgi:cold-inducible RNA-binding protein
VAGIFRIALAGGAWDGRWPETARLRDVDDGPNHSETKGVCYHQGLTGDSQPTMPVRLFVGNLSYEATEAELREHFGTIGPVTYCYLPTDRETGRPRGFAFVEYGDDTLAQEAIARLNDQAFRGRPLAVKEAQPRESRPAGAGPRPYGGPSGGTRPPFGAGAPRPFSGPREGGLGAPAAGPGQRRDREFGPDAPPRGKKKNQYKGAEQRGPKGPIRTKTDNRIYNAFGDDAEEAAAVDFDDFATSRPEGESAEVTGRPEDEKAEDE